MCPISSLKSMLPTVAAMSNTSTTGRTIEMIVRGSFSRCASGLGGAASSLTPG
jgi:hypothetical protein